MSFIKIPDYGKHLVFLGSTGSGKSYLAETMLQKTSNFFIFDTQDVFDYSGAKKVYKPSEAVSAIEKNIPRIIYKPNRKYQNKEINEVIINAIVDSSTKKHPKPRVIYIDEIFHLGYDRSYPTALPVALAISRQRRLSWWIATQRPKLIPTNILSEASYIFCFFLAKKLDIDYLADNIRADKKEFIAKALGMKKEDYAFILLDQTNGAYRILPKIKK